jgi:hypothetical protein
MQVREVPVVGEGLLELPIRVVGVRDLQLGVDGEVAVGVVVDDRLIDLDRLRVVDAPIHAQDQLPLHDGLRLGKEFVGRGYLFEGRLGGALTGR